MHSRREIKIGQRNGTLTRGEAAILKDNLAHIKREYARAKRTDRYVHSRRTRTSGRSAQSQCAH